jgi:hypothetical protein
MELNSGQVSTRCLIYYRLVKQRFTAKYENRQINIGRSSTFKISAGLTLGPKAVNLRTLCMFLNNMHKARLAMPRA